jgi:hypothetical protein
VASLALVVLPVVLLVLVVLAAVAPPSKKSIKQSTRLASQIYISQQKNIQRSSLIFKKLSTAVNGSCFVFDEIQQSPIISCFLTKSCTLGVLDTSII